MIYSLSLSLETFPCSNLLHWDYVNTYATKVLGKTEDACFTYRNGFSQIIFKKGVLKNFASFSEKELLWSLFLINLQAWKPATLLKRDYNTISFFEFCEIFKNTNFTEQLGWQLLSSFCNLFPASASILYSPENIKIPLVFYFFQWIENENIGQKWANQMLSETNV